MKSFNKDRILSCYSKTPEEWAAAIESGISVPHLQGWAASVIYYDYAGDTPFAKRAEKALGSLMDRYGWGQVTYSYQTPDLIKALDSIGYADADMRCALRTNIAERTDANYAGTYTALDRRWSRPTTGACKVKSYA